MSMHQPLLAQYWLLAQHVLPQDVHPESVQVAALSVSVGFAGMGTYNVGVAAMFTQVE
jgi:hypothetical protein